MDSSVLTNAMGEFRTGIDEDQTWPTLVVGNTGLLLKVGAGQSSHNAPSSPWFKWLIFGKAGGAAGYAILRRS